MSVKQDLYAFDECCLATKSFNFNNTKWNDGGMAVGC